MRSLLFCFAFLITAFSAHCAVWFVDMDNTSGNEDGTSWATAFTTIQPAIDAAFADGGGDVWIAAGVYDEPRTSIMHDPPIDTGSLVLKDNVNLFGGFTGTETAIEQRDFTGNETIITGIRSLNGEAAFHVVVGASGATLDGFTVRDGNGREPPMSNSPEHSGAGLFNEVGEVTIANCTFVANVAPGRGGGISSSAGLIIQNSTFEDNGSGQGSAIFTTHDLSIGNSKFRSNSGSSVISGSGVRITIDKCVFRDNAGGAIGAGFTNNFSTVIVSDSLFESNAGSDFGISSGGIGIGGGFLICDRTVFVQNRAPTPGDPAGGAIVIGNGADATITNCTFSQNRSESSPPTLAVGASAGAIATFNGVDLTVINSTFWGNTSAAGVGAIDSAGDFDDVLVVINSVFWNNDEIPIRARPDAPLFHTANVAFSDVEGGFEGQGNIDADPLFVDPANGDFRVQAGSPVIDTATAQIFGVTAPEDDILGAPRPFGAEVDMGAYEFQGELALCALFTDISQQFDQFLADFGLMDIDPGDGLPATGSLALIETASCFLDESLTQATDSAFLTNQAALMAEPDFPDLMPYADLIPALMLASTEMQAAVRSILSGAGLNLTNEYFTVRCASPDICTTAPPTLPKRVGRDLSRRSGLRSASDPDSGRSTLRRRGVPAAFQGHPKGPVPATADHEPYSGSGDPDQDGKTNAQEWDEIVVMNGGTPSTFARAALGIAASGGSSSSCFIATAVYGTPLAGEIQPLRDFRDDHLLPNPLGAALTDFYYRLSPPLADRIANKKTVRGAIRSVLNAFR